MAVKALFMNKIYKLGREISRLRENINKRDQNTGDIDLSPESKIKKYYLEQQYSFLTHESALKQNTISKLLENTSS